MPRVIRLGDPTSHGGKVVSASGNFAVMGIKVARKGDACTCPLPGHTNCVILEGDPTHRIGGIEVAYEGHRLSCGAMLISTLPNFRKA